MASPKIGIVGIGNMGRIHARVLHSMRVLNAVADINHDAAKRIGENYGIPAFSSHQEMLESVELDAVVIATSTKYHASIAEDVAVNYDTVKFLFIEKPLASSLKDAERIASIIKKKKKKAIVSHTEIYNPIVNRALALINDGAIGEARTTIHDRRGFVPPARVRNLGDVFEDLGVHDFDIMSRISSGHATLYAQSLTEGGVHNSGCVMVKFKSGSSHVFNLSREYAGRGRFMDVSGTKGVLKLDLFAQIIKVKDLSHEHTSDTRVIKLPERGATIKVYGEPIREAHEDFLSVIEKGTDPVVGLDDGIKALKVVEACRRSVTTDKPVKITI